MHCANEVPVGSQHRRKVMKQIDVIAAVLVVVGALNWGLIALARFDLVAALFGRQFGEVSAASALVYGLVGLAGLYQAVSWKRVQNLSLIHISEPTRLL